MTSLLERLSPAPSDSHQPPVGAHRLPGPPRSRRTLLALVSLVAVFGSVAMFAGLYASAGHKTAVLVVTRTIEAGQPMTGGDLGQASVSVPAGLSTIPVSAASQLAGKRAAVTIPAGSLLTAGDVSGSSPVPPGDAVVGIALKPGQLPSVGLVAGDQVMVVQTDSPGTPVPASDTDSDTVSGADSDTSSGAESSTDIGVASTGVLVAQATVYDVEAPPISDTADTDLVSVVVSSTLAAPVATAAAADQVSLVLLPGLNGTSS